VSEAEAHAVVIGRWHWRGLMHELARRGRGERESGAFLLANRTRSPRKVAETVYFDDLDPECLDGAVSICGEAFSRLWRICDERGMRVIADVHTHPGPFVQQSWIDAANPMVAWGGHVAIIVPHFAQQSTHPREIGVHVYQGDRTWESAFGRRAGRLLHRTWW
jgi:proteasome lid subunit RPN8/RPN11